MAKWIYKITNNINGKIYIGQSKNPQNRFKQHINDEKNTAIHNAIKNMEKIIFLLKLLKVQ